MHYWEVTFTKTHALETYSGVQKTLLFKNFEKAGTGFSESMFQQPFSYTCSALTPAPWHGHPPGWHRKELPPQQKPVSKFVFVCTGTEGAVQSYW